MLCCCYNRSPASIPLNPINAIASKLAVISAIGIPCIAFGTLLNCSYSLSPANIIIARANPSAVDTAYIIPGSNPNSSP